MADGGFMLTLVQLNTPLATKEVVPGGVLYDEASYFDGYHFQHIADWLEMKRLRRIESRARASVQAPVMNTSIHGLLGEA